MASRATCLRLRPFQRIPRAHGGLRFPPQRCPLAVLLGKEALGNDVAEGFREPGANWLVVGHRENSTMRSTVERMVSVRSYGKWATVFPSFETIDVFDRGTHRWKFSLWPTSKHSHPALESLPLHRFPAPPSQEDGKGRIAAVEIHLKSTMRTREYVKRAKPEASRFSMPCAMVLRGMQPFDGEIEKTHPRGNRGFETGLTYSTNAGKPRLKWLIP